MSRTKNFTILSGHYGSGKTNIAVNFALNVAKQTNKQVSLYDLDIVNPYFRTTDSRDYLSAAGVKLISSEFANTNAEGNPLPVGVLSAFDNPGDYEVLDIGGDDAGALALGRYSNRLKEIDFDLLLVVNKMRPLCSDAQSTFENLQAIEQTAKLKFTGIVNNTNLGKETTPDIILNSLPYADELSILSRLPVVFTTVRRDLAPELKGKIDNIYPIDIYYKPGWAVY